MPWTNLVNAHRTKGVNKYPRPKGPGILGIRSLRIVQRLFAASYPGELTLRD